MGDPVMQLWNVSTNGQWLAKRAVAPPPPGVPQPPDPFLEEASRVASDVFRCNNLVVLSGLGTSLCIEAVGGQKAPTMSDLWELVRVSTDKRAVPPPGGQATDPNFAELLAWVGYGDSPNIEALLSRCRVAQLFHAATKPADADAIERFIVLAERTIAKATSFVALDHPLPVHREFLRRAARRSERKARAKFFTTNYDRAFEEAARQSRFVVIDGFSMTAPPTFDAVHFTYDTVRRTGPQSSLELIPNVVHLYKLHGSVDWYRDTTTGFVHRGGSGEYPLLIYPRFSKYEMAFQQPYLDLISAFQAALREPDTGLVVIGFGFNDNHLAEPIMSALRSNLGLKALLVSPRLAAGTNEDGTAYPSECINNSYLRALTEWASAGDARINFLNASFEQFVALVPDIAAESDLEQHTARLRNQGRPA